MHETMCWTEKMETKKILYAGPWVGEFGWEVAWWNPLIRCMSNRYDKTIVACRKNSVYLYEYAAEIVEISACSTTASSYLGRLLHPMPQKWGKDGVIVSPKLLHNKYAKDNHSILIPEATCINLSSTTISKSNVDIMCNFRIGKDHKEYPPEMCDMLVNLLIDSGYTVGCFGSSNDYCPKNALDLRTHSLGKQCEILGSAKCAVGHSSGAMHLASFCGCPHITWHVKRSWLNTEAIISRYRKDWNPFNIPMHYMMNDVPQPEDVVKEIENLLNETEK